MAGKLDIDTLCNQYNRLFLFIKSLGEPNYVNDLENKVLGYVGKFKTDIENFKSEKITFTQLTYALAVSVWSFCREDEKKSYGILPVEENEIGKLSESLQINSSLLYHFLICAKSTLYLTKVPKAMRHSFVDSAVALYFNERYYLFASISKLIEVRFFELDLCLDEKWIGSIWNKEQSQLSADLQLRYKNRAGMSTTSSAKDWNDGQIGERGAHTVCFFNK